MRIAKIAEVAGHPNIALPLEAMEHLGVAVGDVIQIVPEGEGVMLRRVGDGDADAERQLEIAEQIMDERQDVLRRLAE